MSRIVRIHEYGDASVLRIEDVAVPAPAADEVQIAVKAIGINRAEVMFRMRELVDANRKEIATIIAREHGKVVGDALGEVARGLENVEFACGIPNVLKGGYSEQASSGVDVYSIKQPLGVVAGITPFNFPAMVPMWMFANALVTGNTFVLKPSEKDPSASLFIAELLKQAGLCPSSSEANRNIEQGGVKIDGTVISDKGLKIEAGTFVVQVGKRRFARVVLS